MCLLRQIFDEKFHELKASDRNQDWTFLCVRCCIALHCENTFTEFQVVVSLSLFCADGICFCVAVKVYAMVVAVYAMVDKFKTELHQFPDFHLPHFICSVLSVYKKQRSVHPGAHTRLDGSGFPANCVKTFEIWLRGLQCKT